MRTKVTDNKYEMRVQKGKHVSIYPKMINAGTTIRCPKCKHKIHIPFL